MIDHIGLVVRDLAASKAFYSAVFGALKIPIGGSDEHNLWAHELFIGSPDSDEVVFHGKADRSAASVRIRY
ncbi:MAG TPA: VOC family protein [Burkholderiaceae bacterium]|nr:VOC family protein [Burkholderiaceae bacterium]